MKSNGGWDFVPCVGADVPRSASTGASPVGLWRLVMRFFDVEALHSTVFQAGFTAMGEYIAAKRTASA